MNGGCEYSTTSRYITTEGEKKKTKNKNQQNKKTKQIQNTTKHLSHYIKLLKLEGKRETLQNQEAESTVLNLPPSATSNKIAFVFRSF